MNYALCDLKFIPNAKPHPGIVTIAFIGEDLTLTPAQEFRETGRLKVFKHLNDWFEEFRLYHRKDGRVVKESDDLMSAKRYGIMMLKYARTKVAHDSFTRKVINYPNFRSRLTARLVGGWLAFSWGSPPICFCCTPMQ
jgi:hypothetical protein